MNLKAGRAVLQVIIVLVAVLLVTVGAAWGVAWHTRNRAQQLLGQVTRLELGKATFADVIALKNRYGGFVVKGEAFPSTCSPDLCYLEFFFQNTLLRLLHLAPPTFFIVDLVIRDNHIFARQLLYTAAGSGIDFRLIVDDSLRDPINLPNGKSYAYDWQYSPDPGHPWEVFLWLGPGATIEQRHFAYSFDLSCLSRLGRCGSAAHILPPVWENDPRWNTEWKIWRAALPKM